MISRHFEWKEHPESGATGWLLKGAPGVYDPGRGLQVAHDCFEHLDYAGTLESELEAFGAILYIRGNTYNNYWAVTNPRARDLDPSSILAEELADFLAEREMSVRPRNTHRFIPLSDEDDEEVILRMAKLCVPYLREYLEAHNVEPNFREIRQALRMAPHWMRAGYRKTQRRWKMNRFDLCELFIMVEELVDKCAERAEYGDELVVRIETDAAICQVFIDREERYDY